MNRRALNLSAASTLVAIAAGCDSDQKPSRTATLLNNSQVQEVMQRLASAISGLQGAIAGFDDENWKDVVPEVEFASGDISSAFAALRSALNISGVQQ